MAEVNSSVTSRRCLKPRPKSVASIARPVMLVISVWFVPVIVYARKLAVNPVRLTSPGLIRLIEK